MKKKPSLEEFRSGGGEQPSTMGVFESAADVAIDTPPVAQRTNKTIRIRKLFETKLKERAYQRSMAEGRRVTESDLIDEALERYFMTIHT